MGLWTLSLDSASTEMGTWANFCENTIFAALLGIGPNVRDGSEWRFPIIHYFGIRESAL